MVWGFDTGGWTWSSPAFEAGIIYIGAQNDDDNYGHMYAVDAATGKETWYMRTNMLQHNETFLSGVASSPAVKDDIVYFGSLEGNFYAITANR